MQKVIAFLEQNVQWLAIGLGALFVLFMVYTYVLQPPAMVTIGQETLTPGKVDSYILDNPGKALEMAITGPGETIHVVVPKYVQTFRDAMSWSGAKPVSFAGVFPAMPPLAELPIPGKVIVDPQNPNGPAPIVDPANNKVTALPKPPPPTPAESKFGRSVVLLPGPDGQAPPPPAPGQPSVGGVDKDWVTQLFHISIGDIDKAFAKSKIPPQFYTTSFLQVELQREELDDAGNPVPGSLKTIAPLTVMRTNQPAPVLPDDTQRDLQPPYLQWASANTPDILEPLFYTVAKGDQWAKPGAVAVTQQTAFDPIQYLDPKIPIPTWVTPEQKQQIFQARQAEQKRKHDEKAKSRTPRSAPSRSGPGSSGDPAAGFAPKVNFAPAPGPGARPPGGRPPVAPPPRNLGGDPAGYGPGLGGDPAAGYGGGYTGGNTPAGLPAPGTDYPAGDFSPSDVKWKDKTIDGWCHDETVVANKTYRYQIRYKIKNPVWAAGNVTDPPELANQFAVASDWSVWSSPVTIPPLINFFVKASKSPNGAVVQFDVFKWDKGEQKSASFPVGPGDQIGASKDGIDFATEWTVVDFRDDPFRSSDTQILLVNKNTGKLMTRSYSGDKSDALYKGLKEQIAAAKATETAASGAPGGGAPALVR